MPESIFVVVHRTAAASRVHVDLAGLKLNAVISSLCDAVDGSERMHNIALRNPVKEAISPRESRLYAGVPTRPSTPRKGDINRM